MYNSLTCIILYQALQCPMYLYKYIRHTTVTGITLFHLLYYLLCKSHYNAIYCTKHFAVLCNLSYHLSLYHALYFTMFSIYPALHCNMQHAVPCIIQYTFSVPFIRMYGDLHCITYYTLLFNTITHEFMIACNTLYHVLYLTM